MKLGSILALLVALLGPRPGDGPVLVERTAYLMGTRARIAVWAASREQGLRQLDSALAALEQTERELSTWRTDSDMSALNAAPPGMRRQLSAHLCGAFRVLAEWTRETGGAFDPAIGRVIEAWDVHGEGRVPAPDQLLRARSNSGFDLLAFEPAGCTIARRGDAAVDVGAWGKGEALDRASSVLGAAAWMIDLGGQISVHGTPPGENEWRVAVAHPLYRDRASLEFRMREGSLSTSGGSERDLIVQGRRVGHILDPRTGQPVDSSGSVTVWHASGLVADILSTALFVMGPTQGLAWADARGLSACYLVPHADGRIEPRMTAAFRSRVISSDELK